MSCKGENLPGALAVSEEREDGSTNWGMSVRGRGEQTDSREACQVNLEASGMTVPGDSWEGGVEGASWKDRGVPPVHETSHPRGE